MSIFSASTLASPTGAELHLYHCAAEGPARGVVQINHGLAEHAARYARFADFLAHEGFEVYAHDHRGHGATLAPDAAIGVFAAAAGAAAVIADVDAVHAHITASHPGLPVIIFGHSMGGLVALNYVLKRNKGLAGAAIWNANFSAGLLGRLAKGLLAWERMRLGSDVPSRILPRLTFQDWARKIPGARTPFDWLSRDAIEVDKYIDDPLCGWDASVSMWRDVFDLIFAGADNRNFSAVPRDLPINLIGGGKDPATDGGKATRALAGRLKAMGFGDVEARVLPDTRHESLNEINRDAVMEDFAAWSKRVAG